MRTVFQHNQTKPNFIEMDMKLFENYLEKNFSNYSICVHGIKHDTEESQIPTMNKIVEEGLHIFFPTIEYGMAGTVEPCGLVEEENSVHKALYHRHFPSKTENINIIMMFPQSVFLNNREIYWGYPKRNTCGDHPKYQTDFNCLLSELISSMTTIPREFIVGIRIYNEETLENHLYFNRNYYSLLPLHDQSLVIKNMEENSYIGCRMKEYDINKPEYFREILKKPFTSFRASTRNSEMDRIIEGFLTEKKQPKIPYEINTAMEYFDYVNEPRKVKEDGKSFIFTNN